MSFPDFVSHRMPDYFQICENLAEYFGKSNVIVKIYDRPRFVGGNIFSDFLSIFDIELTGEFATPEQDINPSLTPDEREFKKLVNALDLTIWEIKRFTEPLMKLSTMRRLPGEAGESRGALFSPSGRSELLQECSIVNGRVAREFLGREGADDTLFPDISDSALSHKKVYPGLSNKALFDIIGYIKVFSPVLVILLSVGVFIGFKS
jgi:hypothetical protein